LARLDVWHCFVRFQSLYVSTRHHYPALQLKATAKPQHGTQGKHDNYQQANTVIESAATVEA
jgi:hypothetical protein